MVRTLAVGALAVISPPSQTVSIGAVATFNGAPSFSPDDAGLSFAWTLTTAPRASVATLASDGGAAQIVTDVAGTFVAQLVVTDTHGLSSAPALATVTVSDSAPIAQIAAPSTASLGTTVSISGAASRDSDGDVNLSYAWSISRPSGSSAPFTSSAATASLTPDIAGPYGITLIVTEAHGNASAPAIATIAVGETSPSATIAVAQSATVNQTVIASANATDPDGDPLTYAWTLTTPSGSSNSSSRVRRLEAARSCRAMAPPARTASA